MAKTFGDFILECEMYDHSKEHYELVKECAELKIMEQYLEDQKYYQEHADIILASDVCMTEGYFQESVSEENMATFYEAYKSKKGNIFTKIWNGLKKILRVFSNFFRKIGNKFDETTSKGQKILKHLNKMTLTPEQVQSIGEIVQRVKETETSNFPVMANQPFLKYIKLKAGTGDQTFTDLKNDLAAALSDTVVVANVFTNDNTQVDPDKIGAVPYEAIHDVAKSITKGDKAAARGAKTSLLTTWVHVKKHGIKIDVSTKQIEKYAEELNALCTQLESRGKEDGTFFGGVADAVVKTSNAQQHTDADLSNVGADTAEAVESIYTTLSNIIAQSTRIYTKLNAYRQGVITGLDNFLKNLPDNSNE